MKMSRSKPRHAFALLFELTVFLCLGSSLCLSSEGGDVTIPTDMLPDLKAAVVVKTINFAQWSNVSEDRSTLRLGVVGKEQMISAMSKYQGTVVNGKRLEIIPVVTPEDVGQCQVLYVSYQAVNDSKQYDWLDLEHLTGVLSFGDSPTFNDDDGVIQLGLKKGKLVFTINADCLDDRHLFLSSRLMSVAQIYESK